jgi:hypothetical protein
MGSMDTSIAEKIWDVVRNEGLDDPQWILDLTESDEPPLFTRDAQVEFLEGVPQAERGTALLKVSLSLLEAIADTVVNARLPSQQRIFSCVTFTDFDAWRRGEVWVPTPAIYVDPHEEVAPGTEYAFIAAHTADGHEITGWLDRLGQPYAERFCVAELDSVSVPADLRRVYVGLRSSRTDHFRSIGYYLLTGDREPSPRS